MSQPRQATGLLSIGLTALLSAGCDIEAQIARVTGSFDRTLQVSGPVDLTITNGAGDVRLIAGADGTIHIAARISARESLMSDLSADEKIDRIEADPPIVQNGNQIRIGEIADRALRNNLRIDYDITVPASTTLRSRSGSGDQEIGAIQGPVDIRAGSGDLTIGPVVANVTVRTGSGEIDVQGASGEVVASAGSGDIHAGGVRGPLRARTGSGDIEVEGRPVGDWSLNAASGDVTLRLPGDSGFTLDASTSSGDLRVPHDIDGSLNRSRRHLQGAVRGGGARVSVSTSSGSIRIE